MMPANLKEISSMTSNHKNNILPIIATISFMILQFNFTTISMAKPTQKQNIILMEDDYFTPKTITISAGQTVTWINKGEKVHTVTSADRSITSGRIEPGNHFSYTFINRGTYDYYCHEHSILFMGMKGEVIVK